MEYFIKINITLGFMMGIKGNWRIAKLYCIKEENLN